MPAFSHLHTHSHFSLLTALPQLPDLVKAAKDAGMPALGLTDSGNMYGAIDFYKECVAQGIKPIVGVELAMTHILPAADQRGTDPIYKLVLLAENKEGYQNLLKLVSAANIDYFRDQPMTDRDLLARHAQGIIAIIPALGGELAARFADSDAVTEMATWFKTTFGEENVFAEITLHPEMPEHDIRMRAAAAAAERVGIALIAAHDTFYLAPEDRRAREIMLRIGQGSEVHDDAAGLDLSFKTQEEMAEKFKDFPSAMENTAKIAARCNLELSLGKWIFPSMPIESGKTPDEELRARAYAGIQTRGLSETPEVTERIDYELKIIGDKGFSIYFLVISDLLQTAKHKGILATTRGSAGGSLVSYLTGVTTIDPLAYKLPFERFLNPERPKAPDIDMDYADNRRDEIIEYVKQKYGEDHVAQIGTFGTMMARAAVRDVARALGHPYGLGDRIAKLIPIGSQGFPMTIDRALELEEDLRRLYNGDEDVAEIIDLAKKIEGCARHISVHAAGVVIAPTPLTEWTPIQRDPKGGKIITQYDMHGISDEYGGVGLLKFDFLGIRNLGILSDAVERVKERRGISIDIENIPIDDKKTYDMLARGETEATFQLNGSGMTRFLKELKPSAIHDINAMVALYRPGPMEFIPQYIERKHNPKLATYLDPRMKEYLEFSNGLLVYQDDVLMTAVKLGGYSWLQADTLRKAMGKKVPEIMMAEKEKLVKGFIEVGKLSADKAEKLWKMIEPFAAYGFNKAHAASYGKVAYQTAYMKANYPAEYMAAVLTAEAGDIDTISIMVTECRRMGIEVLPPSVNESFEDFTVVEKDGKDAIRFGLKSVKNFGENIGHAIITERTTTGPFTSIGNFLSRLGGAQLNRRSLESLIRCGAFDMFEKRGILLANAEKLLQYAKEAHAANGIGAQDSLFGSLTSSNTTHSDVRLDPAAPLSRKEMLAAEKELLGIYVSGHPLDAYKEMLDKRADQTILKLKQDTRLGITVTVVGIVEEAKTHLTKNGEKMAFLRIADLSDSIEAVVFPKLYTEHKDTFVAEKCIAINGRITNRNGTLSMLIEKAKPLG